MKFRRGRTFALLLAVVFAPALGPVPAAALGVPAPIVDSAWLKAAFSDPGLVILDLRSGEEGAAEFAAAHIPRAVHAPYPGAWRSERDIAAGAPPQPDRIASYAGSLGTSNASTVVLVPRGSDDDDFGAAAWVYWVLKYLGHDDVAILDGGWNAWTADASSPAASGPAEIAPARFAARLRSELLISTMDVAAALAAGELLVDARPRDEFAGTAKHPEVRRAGHIPGAVNVDQAAFYSQEANALKPADEIARLMPQIVKDHDGQIIAYCNTGELAATDWFVMSEILGIENVRLYDASMAGWSRNDYLPIATSVGQ